MKNPWMSAWLSAANQINNASRDQIMAEMTRQQNTMIKACSEASIALWISVWFPWMAQYSRK